MASMVAYVIFAKVVFNPIQAEGGGGHNVPSTGIFLAVLKWLAVG